MTKHLGWIATPHEDAVEWLAGRRVRGTSWRLEGAAWAGGAGCLLLAGYPGGAGFLVVCGALAFALNHAVGAVALRMRLSRRRRGGQQSVELVGDGLQVSGQGWATLIPWERIQAVETTTEAIVVAGNEEWADVLIPIRSFASTHDFNEFAHSLTRHVEGWQQRREAAGRFDSESP